MRNSAIELPWTLQNVPHAILDILRGCNIRCRDCFNTQPDHIKSLAEIEKDLDTLMRLRKLHSISVVGGEITLHPDLVRIVQMVKSRGLYVELFTNGVDLEPNLLAKLKAAGTSLIFLHIEARQRRPDLSADSMEELRRLRAEKAAQIIAHGMDAGLAITVYPGGADEAHEAVEFTLQSPHLNYLLVTLWRDVTRIPPLYGTLEQGFRAAAKNPNGSVRTDVQTNPVVCQPLEQEFGLRPFAFVGSNRDRLDPRWLSYLVAAVHQNGSVKARYSLKATCMEKIFLEIMRRVTGRYPFYQQQSAFRFTLHLLLNAIVGGGLRNLKPLLHACRPGATLSAKKLLFQCAASMDGEDRLTHCHCCPDAVVRNGGLVPLCISDCVVEEKQN